jgi:hypothetical protein
MHTSTMKTKKAIKYILNHPELFTEGELTYVRMVRNEKKHKKVEKKLNESSKPDFSHT